jgi:hypothetical protein
MEIVNALSPFSNVYKMGYLPFCNMYLNFDLPFLRCIKCVISLL